MSGTEFKDTIQAAGGKVEFLYDRERGGVSFQISGNSLAGFRAMYMIAVSLDGQTILDEVPATGIGQTAVYRQPSVLTFIQSDEQGLWGRNCPYCSKYFRTDHIKGPTVCPYCSGEAPNLAFISEKQRTYITACYDAFARSYMGKINTSVDMSAITDETPAWHYSEEKQQFQFTCKTDSCGTQTDILGKFGFCPACGKTNAREIFTQTTNKILATIDTARANITDRHQREEVWERVTVSLVSDFEALGKHLRRKLLQMPMTDRRRKKLQELNFQRPIDANERMLDWFDIGFMDDISGADPSNRIDLDDVAFVRKMVQKRHILIHNGGLVDKEYLDLSGDTGARIDERIRIRSNEARRFAEKVAIMGANLISNVEDALLAGDQ